MMSFFNYKMGSKKGYIERERFFYYGIHMKCVRVVRFKLLVYQIYMNTHSIIHVLVRIIKCSVTASFQRNLYIVVTLQNVEEARKSSYNRKVHIRLMISVVAMVRQVYHGYIGYHSNQNLYIFFKFLFNPASFPPSLGQ